MYLGFKVFALHACNKEENLKVQIMLQWKCRKMMTNTTITTIIMMVRLTASTSKSIFMIRSPQALLLLRLFRDCSPAPSLCHHLWNVCFLFSLCYIAQQVNIALDQSDLLWGLRRAKSFFVHHGSSLHHLSTQEPLLWSAVSFSWRIQNKNLPKVQQTQLVCWPCTAICSGLSTALFVWIPTYIPESKLSQPTLISQPQSYHIVFKLEKLISLDAL